MKPFTQLLLSMAIITFFGACYLSEYDEQVDLELQHCDITYEHEQWLFLSDLNERLYNVEDELTQLRKQLKYAEENHAICNNGRSRTLSPT